MQMMSKGDSTIHLKKQRSLVSKRSGSNLSITFRLPKKDDNEMNILETEPDRQSPKRKVTRYPDLNEDLQ